MAHYLTRLYAPVTLHAHLVLEELVRPLQILLKPLLLLMQTLLLLLETVDLDLQLPAIVDVDVEGLVLQGQIELFNLALLTQNLLSLTIDLPLVLPVLAHQSLIIFYEHLYLLIDVARTLLGFLI